MKVGLCLSGGGVKGAAHIGVIKALEEAGIKLDCLSGTSSGSIVAALYSMGYTQKQMIELFKSYAKDISKVLSDRLHCDGVSFCQNNGIAQEVKHFHLHVIPKYKTEDKMNIEDVYEILTKETN